MCSLCNVYRMNDDSLATVFAMEADVQLDKESDFSMRPPFASHFLPTVNTVVVFVPEPN